MLLVPLASSGTFVVAASSACAGKEVCSEGDAADLLQHELVANWGSRRGQEGGIEDFSDSEAEAEAPSQRRRTPRRRRFWTPQMPNPVGAWKYLQPPAWKKHSPAWCRGSSWRYVNKTGVPCGSGCVDDASVARDVCFRTPGCVGIFDINCNDDKFALCFGDTSKWPGDSDNSCIYEKLGGPVPTPPATPTPKATPEPTPSPTPEPTPSPTPPPTTPAPTPLPTPAGPCRDLLPGGCQGLPRDRCRMDDMGQHCTAHCGHCTPETTKPQGKGRR